MLWRSYDTVKYVHIRDARLGSLRTFFLVVISVYVGVVEMWAMGGWLESKPVRGVTRFSLQQPTVDNCDPSKSGCMDAFVPMDTLPYCRQYKGNNTYKGHVYNCEQYEATNMQLMSESSLAIITRASVTNQTLVCDSSTDMTCPQTYKDTSKEYKFYTAQSEACTVLLDHAVTQSKICHDGAHKNEKANYACSAESSHYKGRLYSTSTELCGIENSKGNAYKSSRGGTLKDTAPCYIGPNHTDQGQDFFSLDVLLQASGMDLDDCNTGESPCHTYRDTGLTLLLAVYWTDFYPWLGKVEPYYYYKPQLVSGSSYKQYIPFYETYRSRRTLLNAHGVKIAVLLGGEFHAFNAVNFLITLTTALGLLAVATTIVDILMLYILPEKNRYQEAKYECTQDFDGSEGGGEQGNQGLEGRLIYGGGRGDEVEHARENTSDNEELNEPLL